MSYNPKFLLMELMLRKFRLELQKQNIAGWPSGGIALSESSWKQTAGWKYQKALDGIDVAKISFTKNKKLLAGGI